MAPLEAAKLLVSCQDPLLRFFQSQGLREGLGIRVGTLILGVIKVTISSTTVNDQCIYVNTSCLFESGLGCKSFGLGKLCDVHMWSIYYETKP